MVYPLFFLVTFGLEEKMVLNKTNEKVIYPKDAKKSKKTILEWMSLKKVHPETSGKLILHFRPLDPISAEKIKKLFYGIKI